MILLFTKFMKEITRNRMENKKQIVLWQRLLWVSGFTKTTVMILERFFAKKKMLSLTILVLFS